MSLLVERRQAPVAWLVWFTPVLAISLMLLSGLLIFAALGKDPWQAFYAFFLQPLDSLYGVGELILIASPLCLIGLGLAMGYRANIWNIGAEGQLIVGGILATAAGLAWADGPRGLTLVLMMLAGIAGGLLWAGITAFCRHYFNASEILTSLMLTYVAYQLLLFTLSGTQSHPAWLQDPQGGGFPTSALLDEAALLPLLSEWGWSAFDSARANVGILVVLVLVPAFWLLFNRSFIGFQMLVAGQAPEAARYAGFNQRGLIWLCLLCSGAAAGLAGALEIAGPVGQLQASWRPGYGFSAIIVAFIGRLNPIGIALASLILAVTYLGGEAAQYELGLPNSVALLFQGLLLFYLLACDFLNHYRLRWLPKDAQHAD